jgi:hypothetical protein
MASCLTDPSARKQAGAYSESAGTAEVGLGSLIEAGLIQRRGKTTGQCRSQAGQDSLEVLRMCGYDDDEIDRVVNDGIAKQNIVAASVRR